MESTAAPILTDCTPARIVAAVEENLVAWMPVFGLLGKYHEDAPAGVKRSITSLKSALFNSIACARLDADQADGVIDAIISDARARSMPLCWWTGPQSQPADLGERLAARGMEVDESPGMAVLLDRLNEDVPVPPGFTIHHAADEAGLRLYADANMHAWVSPDKVPDYENDPWLCMFRAADPERVFAYYGMVDGRAVATCILWLAAGVAGIYAVGTEKAYRRRGIGARMTLEPLRHARRLGYRAGVLGASEMGFPVYRKLGFEEVCRMKMYTWKP